MKHGLKFLAISFALLLAVPVALAQTPEVSTLTVTEPLDVGGTVLQPGTYLIRVVSPRADRNKVQITDVDRQTVFATALTVPHELEPNEKIPNATFVYFPSVAGQPRVLRTWFPPDPASGGGHDFVYDEARARELARLVNEPVPSLAGEDVAIIQPEVTTQTMETQTTVTTPPVTTTPTPEPIVEQQTTIETETTTPMTSAAPADMDNEVEMPRTASRVPLMALLGLMSLATALVVRALRA